VSQRGEGVAARPSNLSRVGENRSDSAKAGSARLPESDPMDPATPLPTGTVTFLFTDIEGSTRLWEQQPETMKDTLAQHDTMLRSAVEAHRGHVFKTVGDAFYAVFADASDAIRAALEAQWTLHKHLPEVRVRVALHIGEAELREGDYFGAALNRVARLLAAGHGRQILLSEATAERVRPSLPADARLRLLGTHRLRDIAERETIYQ
jgi:class 3 adenylate cyclase